MTALRDERGRFLPNPKADFAVGVEYSFLAGHIQRLVDRERFRNFNHAAARIAKDAKASIDKAEGPSEPGEPPHTHKGKYLSRAIRYAADRDGAVIGPKESVVGESGALHEFGENLNGQQFPERPFMAPALESNLDRFAGEWRGSIGE